MKQWVEHMPETMLANQFPTVPPIFPNQDLIDAFFRQRAMREHEIEVASVIINDYMTTPHNRREHLDATFPQRFDQCCPGWGKPCPFRKMCHGHVSNPLREGFIYREPHHQLELDGWEGVDAT